ncbi:MAG: hemerythrin domain-containing protein [bacterium]
MFATQELRNEHEGILIMLNVIEKIATDLKTGKAANLDHLDKIIDFLTTFVDKCHHGKEEDLLFPALVKAGVPNEGGPVGVMLAEHTQGRTYIKAMKDALNLLHTGDVEAQILFADAALGYVFLLRDHIAKENNVLFVMAENRLSPEEHTILAAGFKKIEDERIGAGVHEQFHALLDQLKDLYL